MKAIQLDQMAGISEDGLHDPQIVQDTQFVVAANEF